MIHIKFLLIAAIVASANNLDVTSQSLASDIINDVRAIVENDLKLNPSDELNEVLHYVEILEALNQNDPPEVKRSKRQVNFFNCTTYPSQLAQVQANITLTQTRINNATINLNNLNNQVRNYENQVATKTGSAQTSANNMLTLYKKLVNSTVISLTNLNSQLDTLRANEAQLNSDFNTYCGPAPPRPCGTFVPYNSRNLPNAPALNGFVGGVNNDGSEAYIGFGNGAACNNQNPAPCAISTTSVGCFIPCNSNQINNLNGAFYLLSHQDLTWIDASSTNVFSILDPLKILGPNNLMFGRTLINGNYLVGKIQTVNGVTTFQAVSQSGFVQLSSGFQVLTCLVKSNCVCNGTASTLAPTPTSTLPSTLAPTPTTTSTTTTTSTQAPTTSTTSISTTKAPISILGVGQSLTPGSTITSPNGLYQTTLTLDGNLIVQQTNGSTIWSSNTTGANVATMDVNGNLILKNTTGYIIWSSSWYITKPVPGSSAQITDNGQLVITNGTFTSFSSTVNTCPNLLGSGETLSVGESRISCNGNYIVTLTSGGNLVVTYLNGTILWSTNTTGGTLVTMRPNGNLVVTDSSNNTIWQSSTFGPSLPGAVAQISNNGQLIVGTHNQTSFVGRLRPQYPCGTFISYDTVSDRGGPLIEGFSAGNYLDGSRVYVGYAANSECNGQTIAPARIRAISPAGGYVGRCGIEAYEPKTAFFLQNNPNLKWVSATSQTLMSVNNALGIIGGNFTFLFARVNASANGLNYVQIGKGDAIVNIPGYEAHKVWWYSIDTDNEEEATDFEILTCVPVTSTTELPTTPLVTATSVATTISVDATTPVIITTTTTSTTTTELPTTPLVTTPAASCALPPQQPTTPSILEKCGTLLNYDPINDRTAPELYGVPGGFNWRDRSIQYVGYGNATNCQNMNTCPGFVSTVQGSAGCYMPCQQGKTEFFDNVGCKYLAWHPDLKWVKTTVVMADKLPGVLSRNVGTSWFLLYARLCANNFITVGRIHYSADVIRFVTENGYQQLGPNTEVEVLTCLSSELPPEPVPEPPPVSCLQPSPDPLETTTILGPCGTLVPYDAANKRTDPELYGVPGGFNHDGTVQYVGYGSGKLCGDMTTCPGYVSTKLGDAGCRMPCQVGKKQIYDNSSSTCYYLAWHPDLQWVTTTPANADKLPGVLTRNVQTRWWLMYARMCAPDDYVTVGRVHYGMDVIRVITSKGYEQFGPTTTIEVLVCKKSTELAVIPPPESPTCGTPDPLPTDPATSHGACGTFLSYDRINGRTNPEKWGVPGGFNYKDGGIQYIAQGNGDSCGGLTVCPGYISINSPAGCFMPCSVYSNETIDNSPTTCKYLAYHPDLTWVTTTPFAADKVPGVLYSVIGNSWFMIYARVCTNDILTFGRVHYVADTIHLVNEAGFLTLGSDTEIQVLVCSKSQAIAPSQT